jgi:hypothetical protein
MKIYEKIELQIKCKGQKDLSDILVGLKIKAGTKNTYLVLFPKTDRYGRAELIKEDLVGQFDDHIEMGLMDYNGTLENAENEVEVSLLDITKIRENKGSLLAWPLRSHEKKKWKTREEEFLYKLTSPNEKYLQSKLLINLKSTNKILYDLKRK